MAVATKWKFARFTGTVERSKSIDGLPDAADGYIYSRVIYRFERYADGEDIPAVDYRPYVGMWMDWNTLEAYQGSNRIIPYTTQLHPALVWMCVEDDKMEIAEGTALVRHSQVWEAMSDWIEVEYDFSTTIYKVGEPQGRYLNSDPATKYGLL